jgi:hypothetical protein
VQQATRLAHNQEIAGANPAPATGPFTQRKSGMATTKVEFAFSIDQKVKTVFDDVGIVKNLSLDDSGCKKVWVMRSNESTWFKELELTAVE